MPNATATATLAPAPIENVVIGSGGSGYTTQPSVVFSGGAGSGAVATATLTGGAVTGISFSNRGSYTIAPTITFTPVAVPPALTGVGSGATATATLAAAPIASIRVDTGGTGYTKNPLVAFSSGTAAATATTSGGIVTAVNLNTASSGGSYTTAPTISFTRVS